LFLLTANPGLALEPPSDPLTRVYYELEVASYCGLVSAAVHAGFRREARPLEHHVTRERLERSRMDAWQAAHLEWQNRGLGGFKRWCRNEGRAAAARFLAVPE
jgi:hypothetical protein